jgi:hypothetical protein
MQSELDTINITHVTLVACDSGETMNDYLLIKTPVAVLNATVERQAMLDGAGPAFAALDFEKWEARVESNMSRSPLGEVDMTSKLQPLGRDETCAYLGGNVSFETAARSWSTAVATCLTAVAGRVISINWYGPVKGSGGVVDLLRKSKALAERTSGKTL